MANIKTKRLFIALDLPEASKELLAQVKTELKLDKNGLKAVEKENFHFTLVFLGGLDSDQEKIVLQVLDKELENTAAYDFALDRIKAFPGLERPRVIYMAAREKSGRLEGDQENIVRSLEQAGIRPDRKRFQPHITLARVKYGSPDAGRLRDYRPEHYFQARKIGLYQSILAARGPIYSLIKAYELKAPS